MIASLARLIIVSFVAGVALFNLVTFALAFARHPPRHVVGAFFKELLAGLLLIPAWPLFALVGARYEGPRLPDSNDPNDNSDDSDDTHDRDGPVETGAAAGKKKRRARLPVILLHGYMMNRTNWLWLGPALARRGIGPLYGFSYFTLARVEKAAQRLAAFVEHVARREGAEQVDVVAHSMGGLVARFYIEQLGGAARVRRLVTIGTPHRGTHIARFAFDGGGRDLHPTSAFQAALGPVPAGADYTSIWSRCDNLVVPPDSAQLTPMPPEEGESAVDDLEGHEYDDIVFDDLGHLSLLVSPRVADAVARRLSA